MPGVEQPIKLSLRQGTDQALDVAVGAESPLELEETNRLTLDYSGSKKSVPLVSGGRDEPDNPDKIVPEFHRCARWSSMRRAQPHVC